MWHQSTTQAGEFFFYRTSLKLVMLYETKYWTAKNQQQNKINVTKMKI